MKDVKTKPADEHLEQHRLISFRELARILGVHPRTARTWLGEGRLPPSIRIGNRRLRWRLATVTKFLSDLETPRADDVA
jgi:excisionase family DNA binding protein